MLIVGGITALQNSTIVTGLPFAFVMVLLMFGLYKDSQRHSLPAQLSGRHNDPDGARTIALTWRQRLRRGMSFPDQEMASAFLPEVALPALTEVGEELRKHGIEAEVHDGEDGSGLPYVELVADLSEEAPFQYRIVPRETPLPVFGDLSLRKSDVCVQSCSMMEQQKMAIFTEVSLILAAVFWGLNYATTKYAAEFLPPLLIVALRFTTGGILMYCLLRIVEPDDRLKPGDLLPVVGLGCLGVAIGQTAFTFGVSMTSAANTGLIFATAPIWGLLLGLMLGLERPAWRGVAGVGLSIFGVFVVFFEGLGTKGTSLAGDLFVLLAAMAFGSYTVLSMPVLARHSPLTVATYSLLFGGLILLLLSSHYLTGLEWESVGAGAWAAVAFSAVFATAFSFSAWQTGVSRIGANRVLVYQYLITATGVASGIVFFGESLGVEKIVGGVIILLGVYLARRSS
jgi:drug/metabolite transporter (DMT)-like permease